MASGAETNAINGPMEAIPKTSNIASKIEQKNTIKTCFLYFAEINLDTIKNIVASKNSTVMIYIISHDAIKLH